MTLSLARVGVSESPRQLMNKINRGTFTFAFFLKCMKAIGAKDMVVRLLEQAPTSHGRK